MNKYEPMLFDDHTNIITLPNARAFVFGGSYGNLQATEAVLGLAHGMGFSPNEIIFTGDSVAYCGEPQETVDLLRESGIHAIKGNCEESLAKDADDCGCGFDAGSACNLLSVEWYRFCQKTLNKAAKAWMASLPGSLTLEFGDHRLKTVHGTPNLINQFVFESDLAAARYIPPQEQDLDGYVTGHSGIPFLARTNGKAWINSGAAGMPANDGTRRVWCAVIESKGGVISAQTIPVEYDHRAATQAMHKAGLNNGYLESLSSGVWPSHDVLPEAELQKTGKQLKPASLNLTPTTLPYVA